MKAVRITLIILAVISVVVGCGLYIVNKAFDALFMAQMEKMLEEDWIYLSEAGQEMGSMAQSDSLISDVENDEDSMVQRDNLPGFSGDESRVYNGKEGGLSSDAALGVETQLSGNETGYAFGKTGGEVSGKTANYASGGMNAGQYGHAIQNSFETSEDKPTASSGRASADAKRTKGDKDMHGSGGGREPGVITLEKINLVKDQISLGDKAKAIAIVLSRLTPGDINRLKNMIKGGVTLEELNEAKQILKSRVTEEEKEMLKEIYIKYVALLG